MDIYDSQAEIPCTEPITAELELLPFPQGVPQICRMVDLLGLLEQDAAAAHEAYTTNTLRGPITGFPLIDRELGGAFATGLHMVHGSPGAGKTAFILQIAAQCGFPCLFVTCEMSPLELLRRIIARTTSTYLGRLKTGELSPDEITALAKQAITTTPLMTFADATTSFADPQWIIDQATSCKGDARNILVVIDSLHSWSQAAPGVTVEYEALNAGIEALRKIAAALSCPVLAVSERNRESMKSGGLNAGAGTRKIEYAGETVMSLDADEIDKITGERPVRLTFAKNRHNSAGKQIDLSFHGAIQRYSEA